MTVVPPLVSLILTAILAVIAWSNRRGRITTAFAEWADSEQKSQPALATQLVKVER